jgi:hypothetical protein
VALAAPASAAIAADPSHAGSSQDLHDRRNLRYPHHLHHVHDLLEEVSVKIYGKGARVAQPTYGPGTITDANAHHTVIDFDQHGLRTFVTSLVTLAPTSEPAPERAKSARRKRAVVAK